jgi:hypothetical protein
LFPLLCAVRGANGIFRTTRAKPAPRCDAALMSEANGVTTPVTTHCVHPDNLVSMDELRRVELLRIHFEIF